MSAPTWITPAGFLGTVTERTATERTIQAVGNNVRYDILNGSLPGGLRLSPSTGLINGTPYSVGENLRNQFVVRAIDTNGVTDRTFFLDVQGPTDPIWLTPSGFLPTGISNQNYSINKQFVDYQLRADYDKLPAGQKLRYYIGDGDGSLPPGLEITEDGRIVGQINDVLKLTYKAVGGGGFDIEPYDEFPYDHRIIGETRVSSGSQFIAKTYQFYVSVTDGVSTSKRYFKIKVEDPSTLRVDNTYIDADTGAYLADSSYLLSPQWLTPANLGVVRANNKQVIKLDSYDFSSFLGPTSYDWDSPTINQDGTIPEHPPHFKLDTNSGILYSTLPYQPAYSQSYTFTVFVTKLDRQTKEQSSTARTFILTIRGDVESTIEFVSDDIIGTLSPGQQSELSVVAKHIGSDYTIHYTLTDGRLPNGLSLGNDGTIKGQIDYQSQTYLHWYKSNYNGEETFSNFSPLILDGGTTTFDKKYKFTVQASDVYRQSSIEKDFYIIVAEENFYRYTKLYMEPLLKEDQRQNYSEFINNRYTFDKSLMYRINDPAFGIQQKIQLYLEHGLEQVHLNVYADELRKYFYRKRFYFGDVKFKKAKDSSGNYVYDIVYVDVIDPLEGLSGSKTVSNIVTYPNSAVNMRARLEAIKIQGETILVDEYMMPRFMRTVQQETGAPLGFILAVPLCYALPGKGDTIVKRIKVSKFKFNSIDFDIDRLIVKDNLTEAGAKYLLFPRKDPSGNNLGESLSYISDLQTEDGDPIFLE
jgi:hypothetical protein